MRKGIVAVGLALACAGCASSKSTGVGGFFHRDSCEKQLAQADEMLTKGDHAGAVKALNSITNSPAVPGVTDEALFRLALLTLKPSGDKPATAQGHQLLRRLAKEYPKSPWTQLAAPVTELVTVAEEQKRQNKNLKGVNQSLNREINELNRNIEQLKHLDQELERKSR